MTTESLHPETIALHGGSYRKDASTNYSRLAEY